MTAINDACKLLYLLTLRSLMYCESGFITFSIGNEGVARLGERLVRKG